MFHRHDYEAAEIRERILDLQRELNDVPGNEKSADGYKGITGKRLLSAQGIANIGAGAKRRCPRERELPPESGPSASCRRRAGCAGGSGARALRQSESFGQTCSV